MKGIDYSKLNARIIEQAYASAGQYLTEEQKNKLIQDKLERARLYQQMEQSVFVKTDR
jgi:hypothetical protein